MCMYLCCIYIYLVNVYILMLYTYILVYMGRESNRGTDVGYKATDIFEKCLHIYTCVHAQCGHPYSVDEDLKRRIMETGGVPSLTTHVSDLVKF